MASKLRAVVYVRKSFEDKKHSAPIDQQLKDCRNFCGNHGYKVIAEFSDGESGRLPLLDMNQNSKMTKSQTHF